MVIGASAEEPVIFALAIFDRQVVDAGDAPSHQALVVELPILVTVATKPGAGIVVPFICKAHGYPVVAKRPNLLDQPIVQLTIPFAREKCLDRLVATNELGAVAPEAIHRIGKRYFGRIARVPGILGEARLLRGAFGCKGRQRWAGHGRSLLVSDWPLAGRCSWGQRSAPLCRHLENDFQLDRSTERKACDAIHQAARALVFSEDISQQLGSGVSYFRLIADISRSGHRHAKPDNSCYFVERSQMLPRDSEDIERRELSSLAPRFHIELPADPPTYFPHVALRGKHPAQKKQIARLHRFHICPERLRRRWELDGKFFQPLLGAGRAGNFGGYHLPTCAPPSTCSTSPVT